MKKMIQSYLRKCALIILLVLGSKAGFASHIVGVDLSYKWVSGSTYEITFIAYGNCGAASASCFGTLPTSVPQICIYDGPTYVTSINLTIIDSLSNIEITPVCPTYLDSTQCHSPSATIPGIKKFVYTGLYTVPHNSTQWRFFFESGMGPGCGTGRAAAITNVTGAGGTLIQVVDTLNSYMYNNSSPSLLVDPVPFYCLDNFDCYNPGAVVTAGDSLVFYLVAAGNGSGACSGTFSPVSYVFPATGSQPLSVLPGSFSFNSTNGQICFNPNVLQRSVVVYNIEHWRHDTLCGTSQREMTFTIQTCTNTAPGGGIDSVTGNGVLVTPTNYRICSNDSTYTLRINPRESDTFNTIYITYASLPPSAVATLTGNGTNHPNFTLTGNTAGVPPGSYTFSLNIIDNNCPIAANEDLDYTVDILPVPSLSFNVISVPTCLSNEVVLVTPGGQGNPWTVYLTSTVTGTPVAIQTFTNVSAPFYDTILPPIGVSVTDSFIINTIDSNLCQVKVGITINPVPPFKDTAFFVSPPYCGSDSGFITLDSLPIGTLDTIRYKYQGIWQTIIVNTVDSAGQIIIPGLLAGTYDSIIASYGNCVAAEKGPLVLQNPTFQIGNLTFKYPTRCGYCDGTITVHGLHPGQTDTLNYQLNGTAQPPIVANVTTDSNIYLSNLCPGVYSEFIANTDGFLACHSATIGPVILDTPKLLPQFTYTITYGCQRDTVRFTNFTIDTVTNYSSDSGLFYSWNFGDGTTDTTKSPVHTYPISGGTFHVVEYVNNLACQDSLVQNISLLTGLNAAFTAAPNPACQGRPVTFTNSTVGTGLSYSWNFGDGNTSIAGNPVNSYTYTGTYKVTYVATDFVPCSDTLYTSIAIDSISGITLAASDSTLCIGGGVTFGATYSAIGNTGIIWNFGDGTTINNVNPVQHSYDNTGTMLVTAQALYRVCPDTSASTVVRVYKYPSVYLGPDTAICPGGDPVLINDYINAGNGLATWVWNTGDAGPSVYAKQPGTYIVTVTIDGCATMDTLVVNKDCYVNIPNIFSPNGDGRNDYFYPRAQLSKGLVSFNMTIYNRWGQLVFQTTSLDGQGWDGTFNNINQPEGVYIYMIDATFKDGQIEHHQGNVTLIR